MDPARLNPGIHSKRAHSTPPTPRHMVSQEKSTTISPEIRKDLQEAMEMLHAVREDFNKFDRCMAEFNELQEERREVQRRLLKQPSNIDLDFEKHPSSIDLGLQKQPSNMNLGLQRQPSNRNLGLQRKGSQSDDSTNSSSRSRSSSRSTMTAPPPLLKDRPHLGPVPVPRQRGSSLPEEELLSPPPGPPPIPKSFPNLGELHFDIPPPLKIRDSHDNGQYRRAPTPPKPRGSVEDGQHRGASTPPKSGDSFKNGRLRSATSPPKPRDSLDRGPRRRETTPTPPMQIRSPTGLPSSPSPHPKPKDSPLPKTRDSPPPKHKKHKSITSPSKFKDHPTLKVIQISAAPVPKPKRSPNARDELRRSPVSPSKRKKSPPPLDIVHLSPAPPPKHKNTPAPKAGLDKSEIFHSESTDASQSMDIVQGSPAPPPRPKRPQTLEITPLRVRQLVKPLTLTTVKVLLLPANGSPPFFLSVRTADVRFDHKADKKVGHLPDMRSFWGTDGWNNRQIVKPSVEMWRAKGVIGQCFGLKTLTKGGVLVNACVAKVASNPLDADGNTNYEDIEEGVLESMEFRMFLKSVIKD